MTNEELQEKTGFYLEDVIEMLKSDSVFTVLRYGFKNPSDSGADDCDDFNNISLYGISKILREEINIKID